MHLIRYRFLLYPVLFVLFLFVLDKLFLLPEVRDNFIQPGGMFFYRQRELQIGNLKTYLSHHANDKTKVAVVFGDSRSFGIGDAMIRIAGVQGWKVFNFAGPQAVPAYHDYLARRIFNGLERPGYLILGLSLDGFNRNSGMFFSPTLNYGVDDRFIDENRSLIPERDLDAYRDSRRFALVGMEFSFKYLVERIRDSLSGDTKMGRLQKLPPMLLYQVQEYLKNNKGGMEKEILQSAMDAGREDLSLYRLHGSARTKLLETTGGAQYAWFGAMSDRDLKRETDRLAKLYLGSFTISEEQIFYLRRLLRRTSRAGVKTVLFWPRVNPHMQQIYRSEPRIVELQKRIDAIAREEGVTTVDLNAVPEAACNQYYDASHLSISCFPPIVRLLLGDLEPK